MRKGTAKEKCNYEDKDKEDALQAQLGVPVITLKTGVNGVFDDNFKKSPLSAYYVNFRELFNELIQDQSLEGFLDFSEIIHYLYLYGDFSFICSKYFKPKSSKINAFLPFV